MVWKAVQCKHGRSFSRFEIVKGQTVGIHDSSRELVRLGRPHGPDNNPEYQDDASHYSNSHPMSPLLPCFLMTDAYSRRSGMIMVRHM